MKLIRILLWSMSVVIICMLDACLGNDDLNLNLNCVRGEGSTITREFAVGDFHSINTSIVGQVFITQGPVEDVSIETHPSIFDITTVEVTNGVLNVTHTRCTERVETFEMYITVPDYEKITFTGVGNVTSINDIEVDDLELVMTGVGGFSLRGETTDFDVTLSGVGDVSCFNMISANCDVSLSGLGDVSVTANSTLDVIISGDGDVYYKGNPTITMNISGSGSVIDSN